MSIRIEISDDCKTEQKMGKKGPYCVQDGWAYLQDSDGKEERYPRKINIYVGKELNDARPHGEYFLSPAAITVDSRGNFEIGFPELVKSAVKLSKAS